jgi:hypothetical protein
VRIIVQIRLLLLLSSLLLLFMMLYSLGAGIAQCSDEAVSWMTRSLTSGRGKTVASSPKYPKRGFCLAGQRGAEG